MKIASTIARYLLGLMFTVFGLNGFLQFMPAGQMNQAATQFMTVVFQTHFLWFFMAIQLIAGLLLLSGFFVPLALVMLAAELYNILAFHLTVMPGIAPGLVACVLWLLVFLQYKESFRGILASRG